MFDGCNVGPGLRSSMRLRAISFVAIGLAALSLFVLALLSAAAATAAPEGAAPAFECRWTGDAITIDGKADEPAWASAQRIETFRRAWEGQRERAPKTRTTAKLLWDDDYVYFL